MSFNVKNYLADIDREIVQHRQEIAKRRLRISELEDTRVLMMQREEYRAEMAGETSPFGTLPPNVEIAVRQQVNGTALPAPTAREAKAQRQRDYRAREKTPERIAYKAEYTRKKAEERRAQQGLPLNAKGNRRGMGPKANRKPRGSGAHNRYKAQIITMLKGSKAMLNIDAIIDRLGEGEKHGKARQPVYQALYELKRDAIIYNPSGTGTYAYNAVQPAAEPQPPSQG